MPKPCEQRILDEVAKHEAEFGRELPAKLFFKSIALDIKRKYGLK